MTRPSDNAVITTDDMGPALRALSPQHREFVLAYADGASITAAMRLAGFPEPTARTYGSKLIRRDDVTAALFELGRTLLKGEGARSIRTMIELRDDTTVAPPVRLKAAEAIANRSGFHLITESHEHHHVHMSEAEQDRRILALAAELGMSDADAQKLLIAPADMQQNSEGVFEIAPPPADMELVPEPVDADQPEPTDDQPRPIEPQRNPTLAAMHRYGAPTPRRPAGRHPGKQQGADPSYIAKNMRAYRERIKAAGGPEAWKQLQLIKKTGRDLKKNLAATPSAVGSAGITPTYIDDEY